MIDERFVILGAVFEFFAVSIYIVNTLKGKTKPNKVTWFIWALAPFIAFFAQIKQGVGIQSLLTFMVGFGPFLVLLASFVNKNAYWKIGKLDIVCGLLAIVGLVLWQITKEGNLAIIFSISTDAVAAIPTIIKAYNHPETESYSAYLGGAFAALITLLTIKTWTLEYFAFPLYILLICLFLASFIKFRLGKR